MAINSQFNALFVTYMMKFLKLPNLIIVSLVLALPLFLSCNKEDGPNFTPIEKITTVTLTLSPVEGGDPVFWSYSDPDGPGGNGPDVVFEYIRPGTIYDVYVKFYDESVSPGIDRTPEIMEEGSTHQLFYTFREVSGTFEYLDFDENGFPVGLHTQMIAYGPSEGLLNVHLVHEAEKDVPGVSDGDITNAGGVTDIDINFLCSIKN